MTWIVSVHGTGGSTAEAIEPEWIFTVLDEQQAIGVSDTLQAALDQKFGPHYYWVRHYEAHPLGQHKLPAPTGAVLQQLIAQQGPVAPGRQAVDFGTVAEDVYDSGDWPELGPEPPKPVNEEEEAAAIASILGTTEQP